MNYKIAIVGATGIVGRETLKILHERNIDRNEIVLYASAKSANKAIKIGNRKYVVRELNDKIFNEKLDFALFCTRENISEQYVKKLAKTGTKVVDFSSIYRKKYPLIVPEVNREVIRGNIICNPNCSTSGAVVALNNIHKKFGLDRVVYSTYQAVSGAGKGAIDDLHRKTGELKKFAYPIAGNIIPYIGEIDKAGYSKEENKMIYETRKILGDKTIRITATCVRVPVEISHGESINFKTKKKCTLEDIKKTLTQSEGVYVQDEYPHFPMPIDVAGQNNVFVGRIRKDASEKNSFNMFIVSDNLRKGAAQNGVQILEELIKLKEKK